MAAEVAASAGHQVTVFEQHRSPGRKFLLAGRSGLNLTHSEPLKRLLERYGPDRPHLESIVRGFDADAVQRWCRDLGEPILVGSSGRVFPASMRATPLLRAWLGRLEQLGVEFRMQHRWVGWNDAAPSGSPVLRFETGGEVIESRADATILACGGPSWPRVGGDGSWRHAVEAKGVAVGPFVAANCGIEVAWSATMLDRHEGDPLKNVAVSVGGGAAQRGDLVVTASGLEGGPVYAVSRWLRAAEAPTLHIDVVPDLDRSTATERLSKRRKGATQTAWLRTAGIAPITISLVRDATGNRLPNDVGAMAALLKAVPLDVTGLGTLDRAISSGGGIRFDEVDDGLMLRSLPGVFAAGEMLDWEAPTGGYLLQACFSTGVAAAHGATAWHTSAT